MQKLIYLIAKKIINNKKLSVAVVLLIAIFAYVNIFQNGFIYDDFSFVINWELIQDPGNFFHFFGEYNQPQNEEGIYSPLKTCFHALNYFFWGKNVFGHHLLSILVLALGTFFVYKISLCLIPNNNAVAFLCGLLFGLHPVHVESITPLTASVDSIGIVCFFISFYCYIKKTQANKLINSWYVCSIFFALVAIFTYELTLTLPLLMLWYEYIFRQDRLCLKKIIKKIWPFFLMAIIYIFLKIIICGTITRGGYLCDSFYLTMLVTIKALAQYLLIMLFPFNLCIIHEISKGIYFNEPDRYAVLSQSIFDVQIILSILLTAAVIYFAIRMRKKRSIITFCIGWFYICLLPILNIIPTDTYFAQRYLYPGSFGFCLMMSILLCESFKNGKFFIKTKIVLIISIIIFYFARTVTRNTDLKNVFNLLKVEVSANSDRLDVRQLLAVVYKQKGDYENALLHIRKAIILQPDAENYLILGEIYEESNKNTIAINSYSKAIAIDPEFIPAYYKLSDIYASLGKKEESLKMLRKATALYIQQKKKEEGEGD